MIYADNIIERNSVFLRNLNTNTRNTETGLWSEGLGGYGFYSVSYEVPLAINRYYYQRFTYKYTTTNQSPTWVQMYIQGGMKGGAAKTEGLTANTEYTVSTINQMSDNGASGFPIQSGIIYQGPSNSTTGVSGFVKDVIFYDVTELFEVLRSMGIATTTSALKTWCDENLEHRPKGVNYDITQLITDSAEKVTIKAGTIIATEFVEPDGMVAYSALPELQDYYFDGGAWVRIYNNKGNGTVTRTVVSGKTENSPFYPKHQNILKFVTNGEASPYAGGVYSNHKAAENKVFIEKFVAKIPVGYRVTCHYNSQGTGASVSWITSTEGTGEWEEYAVLYRCGSSGSFSTGGHVAITGTDNTSVTWYLAYLNDCDITGHEELKNYSVLPKANIDGGVVSTNEFECRNIIPNGDCSKLEGNMLPTGWTFDTADIAGNAHASIVQPVNASAGNYPKDGYYVIDPTARYKVSYWVKCTGDMTSFLTAICLYSASNVSLDHGKVSYVAGTKTKLANDLNTGDTTITLNSGNNWVSRAYSFLGFRKSQYSSSYNDYTVPNSQGNGSTGMIKSVSGNIVTLNLAYNRDPVPAGTVIVESFDGSTWPYPISKGMLPTDNTWKYVEGYFGKANTTWDGSGGNWSDIPLAAVKMKLCLNLYANTGTVPIKYADIRVEPVTISACSRYDEKILVKGVE